MDLFLVVGLFKVWKQRAFFIKEPFRPWFKPPRLEWSRKRKIEKLMWREPGMLKLICSQHACRKTCSKSNADIVRSLEKFSLLLEVLRPLPDRWSGSAHHKPAGKPKKDLNSEMWTTNFCLTARTEGLHEIVGFLKRSLPVLCWL